jgi:hypothetical protein
MALPPEDGLLQILEAIEIIDPRFDRLAAAMLLRMVTPTGNETRSSHRTV